jgi:hypothetical protein
MDGLISKSVVVTMVIIAKFYTKLKEPGYLIETRYSPLAVNGGRVARWIRRLHEWPWCAGITHCVVGIRRRQDGPNL